MKKNSVLALFIAVAAIVGCPQAGMAQKKGKGQVKNVHNVVAPKEDYSMYIDNPICKVLVADSMVVPVADVLKYVPLPHYMGRYFSAPQISDAMVYENDFGDLRMFSKKNEEGHYQLFSQTMTGRKWGNPELVRINGEFTDIINPFPLPDGQTLYFAARSVEEPEVYSLYTSTLNAETGEYLSPQRLPYPFASTANDVLYIEDEISQIAWLASTRNQPDGMACVYIMQNGQPWKFYDSEEMEPEKLKELALLSRIACTWTSEKDRNAVMKQIKDLAASDADNATDDNAELSTRKALLNKISSLKRQLDEYRGIYYNSNSQGKEKLASTIVEAEQALKELYHTLRNLN